MLKIYIWWNSSVWEFLWKEFVLHFGCGLLQRNHASKYQQLITQWVSSESRKMLQSELWLWGPGGLWCDHSPDRYLVAPLAVWVNGLSLIANNSWILILSLTPSPGLNLVLIFPICFHIYKVGIIHIVILTRNTKADLQHLHFISSVKLPLLD